MIKLIAARSLSAIPVMWLVATIIFFLLYLTPGDPAFVMAGEFASERTIEAVRERLGLNEGVLVRYTNFLLGLLQGDFGTSIFSGRPVLELIGQRAGPTIALSLSTMIVTLPISILFGVIAAKFPNGVFDRFLMALSAIGFSIPAFVLGFVLVYVFALKADLLPVQGYVPITQDVGRFLSHLVLPTITMAIVMLALLARITRASMLEVLGDDYIKTARAKGATERRVLFGHALPNASIPIITVTGISAATMLTGVVIVETVYNIPGIGSLIMDAILKRDYPLIQGITLLFAFIYIVVNLIVDIVCAVLDPRIKY